MWADLDFKGRLPQWVVLCLLLVGVFGYWGGVNAVAKAESAPDAPTDAVITDCTNDTQLRAALMAVGPSTVTFSCGAGAHTIPIAGYLEIPGTIMLDGGGRITLDGGGTSALMQIFANGNATLQNITLQNGTHTGIHAIDNVGKLTLINVTVRDNHSAGPGGAIYNDVNATLTVRNSFFFENFGADTSTTTHGAAIHNVGQASVQNTLFSLNVIDGNIGSGGAIAVMGGHLSIDHSIFSGNGAPDGGALYVGAGTVVTVTSTLLERNRAGYGGAIESQGELQLDYSKLTLNVAENDGGAVWVLGSDLDVTYSAFIENYAFTTGGAISCYGDNVSIINSTLSGNRAKTYGGGLYSTCNVNMSNNTIHGNIGETGGGGIYIGGNAFASIAHVTASANEAPFGAGVYNDSAGSSTLTLQASLLANNDGANCDGVIDSNGYNFSSDGTCGNFVQTGDRQNVVLPLGPLQHNSGPTFTRIPAPTNPVINAIPAGACGFSIDQRDVARPKAGACDSGAVEVFYSGYLPKLRK